MSSANTSSLCGVAGPVVEPASLILRLRRAARSVELRVRLVSTANAAPGVSVAKQIPLTLGFAAFELGILAQVDLESGSLDLRLVRRIETPEIPLIDPGAHVLAHPVRGQAFQAGHRGRIPTERLSVYLPSLP